MDRLNSKRFNEEVRRIKNHISKPNMEVNSFLEPINPKDNIGKSFMGIPYIPMIGVSSVSRICNK